MYKLFVLALISLRGFVEMRNVSGPISDSYSCSTENYRFMARIVFTRDGHDIHLCGASLVNQLWSLTAAHCVENPSAEYFIKVDNSHYPNDMKVPVTEVIKHPEYKMGGMNHNIALLKLDNSLKNKKFTDRHFVQLPRYTMIDPPCREGLVMGWGSSKKEEKFLKFTDLLCANLTFESFWKCKEIFDDIAYSMHICVKGVETIHCEGDSGGPILCGIIQVGIASRSFDCRYNALGVYTRVESYLHFINDTIEGKKSVITRSSISSSAYTFVIFKWLLVVIHVFIYI